ARLSGMGIGTELYDAIVTSGEVVWQELRRRADPFFAGLGRGCLLFSNGGDRSVVEGLDIELVATVEAADFVLIAGLEPDATIDAFAPILGAARARDLLLICGNPDRVTVVGDDL